MLHVSGLHQGTIKKEPSCRPVALYELMKTQQTPAGLWVLQCSNILRSVSMLRETRRKRYCCFRALSLLLLKKTTLRRILTPFCFSTCRPLYFHLCCSFPGQTRSSAHSSRASFTPSTGCRPPSRLKIWASASGTRRRRPSSGDVGRLEFIRYFDYLLCVSLPHGIVVLVFLQSCCCTCLA